LFRIDRRFVKLTASKANKLGAEKKREVGAEGEDPEAATFEKAAEVPSYNDVYTQYQSEAEAEVQEILDEANEKAAQIIEDAQNEIEQERKRAYDEGYAEGERDGKQLYETKLDEQLHNNEESLKNVLDEIARERENSFNELENDIVDLSLDIVRKIINPAQEELDNVYTSLIKNALRQIPTDGKFIIRVAPSEYDKYFSTGSAVLELDSGTTVTATMLRDVSLETGDCVIDTEDVTINAGLESQYKYVKLAFERANQYEPD